MPPIHGDILTAWSCTDIVGPMLNVYVCKKTHSYQGNLYVFGRAFIISMLMKIEIKRINRHYSALDIEAARPQTRRE
jgi:OFA family oxalate/formate antiporter-like MFS transporter